MQVSHDSPLLADEYVKGDQLSTEGQERVSNERSNYPGAHEATGRPLLVQPAVGRRVAHEDGHGARDEEVDEQVLRVAQVRPPSVQDEDGEELDERVESHVLEGAERRDQGGTALADGRRDATDVSHLRREGGGDRGFRLREADANVGRLQRLRIHGSRSEADPPTFVFNFSVLHNGTTVKYDRSTLSTDGRNLI